MNTLFAVIYSDSDGDLAVYFVETNGQQAALDVFIAKKPGRRIHLISAWGARVGERASLENVLDAPTIDTSGDYAKWRS